MIKELNRLLSYPAVQVISPESPNITLRLIWNPCRPALFTMFILAGGCSHAISPGIYKLLDQNWNLSYNRHLSGHNPNYLKLCKWHKDRINSSIKVRFGRNTAIKVTLNCFFKLISGIFLMAKYLKLDQILKNLKPAIHSRIDTCLKSIILILCTKSWCFSPLCHGSHSGNRDLHLFIISMHWDGTGIWNTSSWEMRMCLP